MKMVEVRNQTHFFENGIKLTTASVKLEIKLKSKLVSVVASPKKIPKRNKAV